VPDAPDAALVIPASFLVNVVQLASENCDGAHGSSNWPERLVGIGHDVWSLPTTSAITGR
jgi:hypothetical protein